MVATLTWLVKHLQALQALTGATVLRRVETSWLLWWHPNLQDILRTA